MLWTKSLRMHHSLSKHDYYFLIFVINLVKLLVMFLVLFKVIHNVTVETKPFLSVSSTRSSLLKWLPDEGKDIFRWYDE